MVENSGWGWEHFGLRTEGREGHVFVSSPLDYEDPQHRRGFTFMVQVTDRVSEGWKGEWRVEGWMEGGRVDGGWKGGWSVDG